MSANRLRLADLFAKPPSNTWQSSCLTTLSSLTKKPYNLCKRLVTRKLAFLGLSKADAQA